MGNVPLRDISQAMAFSAELWVLCEGPAPFAEAHGSHDLHTAPPTTCEQPHQLGNNARDNKRDAYPDSWALGAESKHNSTAGLAAGARHHKHNCTHSQEHHSHGFVPTLYVKKKISDTLC